MRQYILSLVERYVGRGKQSGESNLMCQCPFHDDKSPSFSVNVDLGIFQCFSCKRSGGIVKLLKLLQVPDKVIDEETEGIRDEIQANRLRLKWKKQKEWTTTDPFLAQTILPEAMNRPFMYAPLPGGNSMRVLPTKLTEAGFDPEWLNYMEIGYDRFQQRITYPIRDVYGNLAGFSGGASLPDQVPKYKVYQGKRRDPGSGRTINGDFGPSFDEDYPDYQFNNLHHLWNFDSIYPSLFFGRDENAYLIIVEGYKACLWLLQSGYTNTVALMGSTLSDHQASLLHRLSVRIVLFLDNDPPGRKATRSIGRKLVLEQPGVFIAQYPADTRQPDDLTPAEVAAAISGSVPYPHWIKGATP
jgi:DNA primase